MPYNQTIDVTSMSEFLTFDSVILLILCFTVPCILITILILTICCKESKDVHNISVSMEEIGELMEAGITTSEDLEDSCSSLYYNI